MPLVLIFRNTYMSLQEFDALIDRMKLAYEYAENLGQYVGGPCNLKFVVGKKISAKTGCMLELIIVRKITATMILFFIVLFNVDWNS